MDESVKRKIEAEFVERTLKDMLYRCERLVRCYEKIQVMDTYLNHPKCSMKGSDYIFTTSNNVYVNNVIGYAEEQEKRYEEYVEHEYYVNMMAKALQALEPYEVNLLILHIENDKSMRAIANELNISPMTISRSFTKIYKKIYKMIHNY